ncbi:MAG: hypothetical protein JSV88_20770 [Candidatus Aminicenantes bacterium]|nr:MAG: hypothetical protein JSV88_20770 [Candidatus Aminicenantes bacterium]
MNVKRLNVNELRSYIPLSIDLMICSSSYEERCKTIPNYFAPEEIGSIFVIENRDSHESVRANADYLLSRFKGKSKQVVTSISRPLETADSLQRAVIESTKGISIENILIDVTTFTHEALLILLKLLRSYYSQKKILFAYSSASEYSVGDKIENKWLSRGVVSVRTVLGFSGDTLPSRKTHLIVLVGYEAKRALKLINSLEPHSIALGFGKSGSETAEKDTEANQHFLNLVKQMPISYCEVKTFEIYCNDPMRTKNAILVETEKVKDQNIIIAPMNNKITTIGAALANLSRPEIQICYAQPIEYNYKNYSKPGNHCYLIDLPELFEK